MVVLDSPEGSTEGLTNNLKQIPEIVEVVDIYSEGVFNLIPERGFSNLRVGSWDDKPVDAEDITMWEYRITPEIMDFYNFRLIAGEMLTDADPRSLVLLNESAVKLFGWHDPVGKQFNKYTVKGVIKNVYNAAPTIPAKPLCYSKYIPPTPPPPVKTTVDSEEVLFYIIKHRSIMFKYHEGMWESCREKIGQLVEKEHPNISRYLELFNTEEEYNKFLKSENALIKLLSFVSAICILICVFGFVSLVSLTCEERRKSIAIRKINGATAGDILSMFAKEYSLLLVIGAAIAFPTGYFIMQSWLEQYVKQTSIPAWIYVSILFVFALIIVLCVGWQVYKSSIENPAEVVKSE
jgi:ABC-type antimicrobial peptide transport system permease subunit